ncbi:MAG: hypothetical protein Kow0069_29000 [Promethearchaeota archaeon]
MNSKLTTERRIFDVHVHVAGIFMGGGGRSLREYLDEMGVDAALVNPVEEQASMDVLGAMLDDEVVENHAGAEFTPRLPSSEGHPQHDAVLEAVRGAPGRLHGSFWFNPRAAGDPFQALDEALDGWGFKAVKVQSTIHRVAANDLEPLCDYLSARHRPVPLFVHLSPGFFSFPGLKPTDLLELTGKFREVQFVLGHFGYAMEACLESLFVAKRRANVHLDTSLAVPYAIFLAHKVLGAGRLLFGSDAPAAGPLEAEIAKVLALRAPPGDLAAILHDNAARLFLGDSD